MSQILSNVEDKDPLYQDKELTRFEVKVDDWRLDFIEVLECTHSLNNNSTCL